LGTALLRSNRIPKNGARGAKWGVCWRKRFRNFRRTCDKLACCGMCCTIRRRKSRAAWEYPSWQSACGYFGRIDGCARSFRTHCASRCLPKPHPFARGWNARAHGPAASFPWHQATSAATSAGSPVLPCRPLPAHDSGKPPARLALHTFGVDTHNLRCYKARRHCPLVVSPLPHSGNITRVRHQACLAGQAALPLRECQQHPTTPGGENATRFRLPFCFLR